MMANVLAALRSRFESKGPFFIFFFLALTGSCSACGWVLEVASVPMSVSNSLALDRVGRPELPLVPVVTVVMLVVVPSVMVGSG